MPHALLEFLSAVGHYMSFGPMLSLLVYLVFMHGQHEAETDHWL